MLGVVLSGCAGGDPPAAGTDAGAAFDGLGLEATATTGVIRGVVIDGSVVPVAGASVALTPGDATVLSDAEGRFGFADLAAGTYFLTASKAGHTTVQASVDVVAGEAAPAATLLRLQRLPGTEPYVVAMQWDGFMQCSFTVAIAFGTGCLVGGFTDDNSRRFDEIDDQPTFLQSELDWDTTQALGTNLCMRHYASEGIGGEVLMDDVCGPAPLMQVAGADVLNGTAVGSGMGLERVVWVDDFAVDTTLGLALNQQFTVYTHLFHNFAPPEGWTFLADGSPPVPPS